MTQIYTHGMGLLCKNCTWRWSAVINVKSRGENAKRKGADPKRHLKSPVSEPEALKTLGKQTKQTPSNAADACPTQLSLRLTGARRCDATATLCAVRAREGQGTSAQPNRSRWGGRHLFLLMNSISYCTAAKCIIQCGLMVSSLNLKK